MYGVAAVVGFVHDGGILVPRPSHVRWAFAAYSDPLPAKRVSPCLFIFDISVTNLRSRVFCTYSIHIPSLARLESLEVAEDYY